MSHSERPRTAPSPRPKQRLYSARVYLDLVVVAESAQEAERLAAYTAKHGDESTSSYDVEVTAISAEVDLPSGWEDGAYPYGDSLGPRKAWTIREWLEDK